MSMSRKQRLPRSPINVTSFLRRAKVRPWSIAGIVITLLAALLFADRRGWLLRETPEWDRYEGRTFEVIRVIDGDTLDIDAVDGQHPHTRIRFWGIDAPEIAKPRDSAPAEPFGDDAKAFTRRLCEGQRITLRLDTHQIRDRYDRLLAYIELPDGSVVNERLLLDGLARFEPKFPHQHLERYRLLEKQARFAKKGMWKK
jgi:micrococcal nuclease